MKLVCFPLCLDMLTKKSFPKANRRSGIEFRSWITQLLSGLTARTPPCQAHEFVWINQDQENDFTLQNVLEISLSNTLTSCARLHSNTSTESCYSLPLGMIKA